MVSYQHSFNPHVGINEDCKYLIATLIYSNMPNGHILVDSLSIRRRNPMRKVRRNYVDFERWIQVEIMTSIRRGNFDVDLTFKIEEISMSSPRGFFDIVSTLNQHNFCTRCLHCIFLTFSALGTYSKLYLVSRCDFNNNDAITDIGTIGTISFGNFCNIANK